MAVRFACSHHQGLPSSHGKYLHRAIELLPFCLRSARFSARILHSVLYIVRVDVSVPARFPCAALSCQVVDDGSETGLVLRSFGVATASPF
jgi:hypothetical protein